MSLKATDHDLTELKISTIAIVFFRVGSQAFGGWSTTALLLEQELKALKVSEHKRIVDGAVAYGQVLPGATQVAIVSSVGYQLRGFRGAVTATIAYLLVAVFLMTSFAITYFHVLHGHHVDTKLDGLRAALSGIVLANAFKIASKHAAYYRLWLVVAVAMVAQLLFGNSLLIILAAASTGYIHALWQRKKGTQ